MLRNHAVTQIGLRVHVDKEDVLRVLERQELTQKHGECTLTDTTLQVDDTHCDCLSG